MPRRRPGQTAARAARENTPSLQSLISVLNFLYNNQTLCPEAQADPFLLLLLQLVSNSGTGRDHSLCVSRPFPNLNHYVDCGSWHHWGMSLGATLNYLELIAKLPKSLKSPPRILFLLYRWEKWGRHSITMFMKRQTGELFSVSSVTPTLKKMHLVISNETTPPHSLSFSLSVAED